MGFHDVAFLSNWASFYTTFLINVCGSESVWTSVSLKTCCWGKQGQTLCFSYNFFLGIETLISSIAD